MTDTNIGFLTPNVNRFSKNMSDSDEFYALKHYSNRRSSYATRFKRPLSLSESSFAAICMCSFKNIMDSRIFFPIFSSSSFCTLYHEHLFPSIRYEYLFVYFRKKKTEEISSVCSYLK